MLRLTLSWPVSRHSRYSAKPHHVVAREKTSGWSLRSQASLAGKNVEWIGAPVRSCTAASSSRERRRSAAAALRVSAHVITLVRGCLAASRPRRLCQNTDAPTAAGGSGDPARHRSMVDAAAATSDSGSGSAPPSAELDPESLV